MLAGFIARRLPLIGKRFRVPSNFASVYGSTFERSDSTRSSTPLLVSWLAFLISAGTLIFTFFFEHHLLKVAVVPVLAGAVAGLTNSPFSLSPILINSGNRTETVLSVYLKVNEYSFLPYKGPFVLKAGEAVSTTVEINLKEVGRRDCVVTKQQFKDNRSFNCRISLVVSALDPDGWQILNNIALVEFKISDDQKKYTAVSILPSSSTYRISSVVNNDSPTYTIFSNWSILPFVAR